MTVQIDEMTIRQFIEIISTHAVQVINGGGPTGLLQLCRISPIDEERVSPTRFKLDDVEHMVRTAVEDAACGYNVYIEPRTVRSDLKGGKRGTIEETEWVFGLVADCDADKNKGGNITVRPSLAIETSPGNFHLWYLFTRAISAAQAKLIGDAVRASSGTDQDTGVVTQCYRVPGTPNFPSAAKQARGRTAVEPTRIFEHAARLWDPDELLTAFGGAPKTATETAAETATPGQQSTGLDADETTLPDNLLEIIRTGGDPAPPGSASAASRDATRSALFHSVVAQLKRRQWTVDAIVALLEKYPDGIAKKYAKRLRKEVGRSYGKVEKPTLIAAGATGAAASPTPGPGPAPGPGAAPRAGAAPGPGVAPPHVIPTIRITAGQLPHAVVAAEHALVANGSPIFSRAGMLVLPVSEVVPAAGGRKTRIARLRSFCVDSLMEWVADSALFQRYDHRRNKWADIDPPHQLVRMLLVREGRWIIPRVSGVITTPTLRPDGSLLIKPGYDPRTELYLIPGGLSLPPIADRPTREQARGALALLIDLFKEFSFVGALDYAVGLSALLTTLVRGSIPVAPLYLIRAHTPGVGKSYLNDVIAAVAIGDACPVITTTSREEMEKRLGSILLSGDQLVSLDNCTHDLAGELLCQVAERPVVKIRVLGQSQMPRCECRTTVFATGNNIALKGDMVRRGLVCNLDALAERPELRTFERDAVDLALDRRADYVAAALTVIRGYLAAGEPPVCGPIGSYATWSRLVRSPLVWLGQPDPVKSMETAREDDPELADIREFFGLWRAYLDLDTDYTTAGIIEVACAPPAPNDYNPPFFREFLLRVAASWKDRATVVPDRLGWWLRSISGRTVDEHRLIMSRINKARACFRLSKVQK